MSNKYLIVIVEDEYNISSFVSAVLQANGFDTMVARNGAEAIILITSHCPDLVLLDLGLPDMDGQGIIENVRGWSNVPIIVVSARTRERDKVMALESGADDYITKPFNPVEVIARVRSQLRRYMQLGGGSAKKEDGYTVGGIELNDKTKQVFSDGEEVSLTPTEFEILKLLMKNAGAVLSPKEIYENVWGGDAIGAESTVAVHIRHLREKIEINPSEPKYLKVVWAHGYKLEKGDK